MPIPPLPRPLEILQKACEYNGFRFEIIDHYSKHMVEIRAGDKKLITATGGTYPLNLHTPFRLAKDKAYTSLILASHGFAIPKGDYFFLCEEYREMRGDGKEIEDAIAFADGLGYPVFVKPNRGSLGKFAEVIYDRLQLQSYLEIVTEKYHIILIQEVMEQAEFRIFIVDGEIEFAYQRVAPTIVGDGDSSVLELLEAHNTRYDLHGPKMITPASAFLHEKLKEKDLEMESVLPKGETLRIAAKSNVSAGGTIKNYQTEFSAATREWSHEVAKIMNLRICGLDVFTADGSLDDPEKLTIIEVNGNPSLKGIYEAGYEQKALEIWGKILKKYFDKPSLAA